jgi:hypothetical protein
MTSGMALLLADAVLALHLAIILFNVFGLLAIPLGGWLGWRFVRVFWWRAAHVAILGIVALQAGLGRACFLTAWQAGLLSAAGEAASREPLIAGFVNHVVYWPLPIWAFAAIYVAVCVYVVALWALVPPRRSSLRQIDSGGIAANRRS